MAWPSRLVALACFVVAAPAAAQSTATQQTQLVCKKRQYLLPVGATLGAALHPGNDDAVTGFVLGGEVSLTSLEWPCEGFSAEFQPWIGGYVDGLYDFGNGLGRVSTGPELGYGIFGLDGGPLLQLEGDDVRMGGQVRFVLTTGFVAFYVRQGFVPDAGIDRFTELGALLKLPIPIFDSRYGVPYPQ
jgi:hypothetical protein